MSDSMKGFKISDATPKAVDRKASKKDAGQAADEGPPPSVGFPRIESEVEHDGPSLEGLRARLSALEEMAKSGNMKEKPAAKKAADAYARTVGLLDHLLATKQKLGGGSAG